MRLLHTTHLDLVEFNNDQIPAYGILSHTWGDQEVLFNDIQWGRARDKAGYEKIRHCCKQAVSHGLEYVWIDTCCINKDSSAELSEAINSMYAWYQNAKICFAYLADVPAGSFEDGIDSAFTNSRWFRRGWCLQELIAPASLTFSSQDWVDIGTKITLAPVIARTTGISVNILTGEAKCEGTSLAKRMSWASRRETTRVEDIAYCLMGLFDVNMPLLYGEGPKAFIRLQEEIIKHSDDQSLFAWTDSKAEESESRGLLALSPANFADTGHIVPYREWEPSNPFSISNKGLRIELHLAPYETDIYVAALHCPAPPDYENFLGIYLKRVTTGYRQYTRVKSGTLCRIATRGNLETVYVRNSAVTETQDNYPLHMFQMRKGPLAEEGYTTIECVRAPGESNPGQLLKSADKWPPLPQGPYVFKINKASRRLAGVMVLERHDGQRVAVMLGSRDLLEVGFDATAVSDPESFDMMQAMYRPKPSGETIILDDHYVRVNIRPQVSHRTKFYMVDLIIDPIYHGLDPMALIRDIMPQGLIPPDERPPNAQVRPAKFGKFKMPWKTKGHPNGQEVKEQVKA